MNNKVKLTVYSPGLDFAIGDVSQNELDESIEDGTLAENPFELTDEWLEGPLYSTFKEHHTLEVEIEEDGKVTSSYEHPIFDLHFFNTNKEIKSSSYFTEKQKDFVVKEMKEDISSYYEKWKQTYSDKEPNQYIVEEYGKGEQYIILNLDEPFEIERLFFLLADKLPEKEETIIAKVGYKKKDESIIEEEFEHGAYRYYGRDIKYEGGGIEVDDDE